MQKNINKNITDIAVLKQSVKHIESTLKVVLTITTGTFLMIAVSLITFLT